MYIPKGVAQQEQLAEAIASVERMLGPDVVRIKHALGTAWSGEDAIFFKVVLSDSASNPSRLHAVTSRVREIVRQQVDPLNNWGLVPYFTFRSQSEQAMLQEPAWA